MPERGLGGWSFREFTFHLCPELGCEEGMRRACDTVCRWPYSLAVLLLGSHFPSLGLRVFTVLVMAAALHTSRSHGTGRQGLNAGGDRGNGESSRQIRWPVCGVGVGGQREPPGPGQEASFTRWHPEGPAAEG